MGYYITEINEDITIKKQNIVPAFRALTIFAKNKLNTEKTHSVFLPDGTVFTNANSANIYFGGQVADTDDLLVIMHNMSFEPFVDESGDIISFSYAGEKWYQQIEDFADVIAPFVEPDSVIDFEGEQGEFFRYTFDGQTMREKAGTIEWED